MSLLGKLLTVPVIRDWVINQAMKTEYYHIPGYMNRWWFFNGDVKEGIPQYRWLPRFRIHHILREDEDRPLHDHPADFRTWVLKGYYVHETEKLEQGVWKSHFSIYEAGDSYKLKFGEFHSIRHVSNGGVWTLFMLGPSKGVWGFKVDGKKVPWREYMAQKKRMDYGDKVKE